MTPEIIPSMLYKPKVFEAVSRFKLELEEGGRRLISASPSLEEQMSQWVEQTRSLIVAFGPVMVCAGEDQGQWVETRTIALTYVPAVQQGSHVKPYGQATPERLGQVAAIPQLVKPAVALDSDDRMRAGASGRKPLRVPSL